MILIKHNYVETRQEERGPRHRQKSYNLLCCVRLPPWEACHFFIRKQKRSRSRDGDLGGWRWGELWSGCKVCKNKNKNLKNKQLQSAQRSSGSKKHSYLYLSVAEAFTQNSSSHIMKTCGFLGKTKRSVSSPKWRRRPVASWLPIGERCQISKFSTLQVLSSC